MYCCLHYIFYQEYCISYPEVLIFYAGKHGDGQFKNLHVFIYAILLKS